MDIEQILATARWRVLNRLPSPAARKSIRVEAGLTQRDVAAVVGVSRSEVSRWESGRVMPSRETAGKYLALLERLSAEALI